MLPKNRESRGVEFAVGAFQVPVAWCVRSANRRIGNRRIGRTFSFFAECLAVTRASRHGQTARARDDRDPRLSGFAEDVSCRSLAGGG